jgi:enterochelin esterase family protein
VAEVAYYSESLKRFRRMHVYTPPGFESGEGRFPVLYLLHGASDSDDSWTSVGRAGFILDNLIAAGKAQPMIVVMPAGHTGPFRFGPPGDNSLNRQIDEFTEDFLSDVKPRVENTYRVHADRAHRAMAGLSMGGAQTLNIAIPHLQDYAYLGVFSSGVFGIASGGRFGSGGANWEERHAKSLDDAELKQGLELVWFATGHAPSRPSGTGPGHTRTLWRCRGPWGRPNRRNALRRPISGIYGRQNGSLVFQSGVWLEGMFK